MKHKTIQQLRDSLNKVLKRGRPKQLNKLRKAYHGKRLKKWWSSYASWECCTIAELKDDEHVGHRMKGGHHHRRNYCICNMCGHWFRRNKGIHDEDKYGPIHICGGVCDELAIQSANREADVGGGFQANYWDNEEIEGRVKKNEKV